MTLKPRMVMPDFTGRIIDDRRLELLGVLGSGSYGVVYLTLDITSPSHDPTYYAVKCLQKAGLTEEQLEAQFREIKFHSRVSAHPNVLTYHRVWEEEHFLFVVLDLCHGGNLFNAIKERRVYHRNDHLAKMAILQLIDALSSCHDAGIFHRDLKPENILCGPDGLDLRLADFGLATDKFNSQEFGTGSLFYMSPECLGTELKSEQSSYSTRHSDIWSLGIIIINIITGLAMWRSANSTDERFKNYIRNPDIIRSTHPISRGVANIMKRIFIINPLARITLVELREEIVKLDTFFMSKQDLYRAPLSVREAAVNYSALSFPYSDTLCPCDHSSDETYGVIEEEVPEEQYLFPSPGPDAYYSYLSTSAPRIFSPTREEHVVFATLPIEKRANNHSGGSSSSGPDSGGKFTPETYAVDPAVEVPGSAGWESLDHSVVSPEALCVAWNKKLPTQSLFKAAVQRVKAKVQNFGVCKCIT